MKKTTLFFLVSVLIQCSLRAQPSTDIPGPDSYQQDMIARRYGMFVHFSINTFNAKEWSDGTLPASSFDPQKLDIDQWVRTAHEAGMKFMVLTTKHHDGFCLWDSRYTDYDVASSLCHHNIVREFAEACAKYGMGMGLYYSLWDRHHDCRSGKGCPEANDSAYNSFMITQIDELIAITKPITPIVEFFFDGAWVKDASRWHIDELYAHIKAQEPQCVFAINNAVEDKYNWQKKLAGVANPPLKYFPIDFRTHDPFTPAVNDIKIYTRGGRNYYLFYETAISNRAGRMDHRRQYYGGRWFYNKNGAGNKPKPLSQLIKIYHDATSQNNILLLNVPPTNEGLISDADIRSLMELKKAVIK